MNAVVNIYPTIGIEERDASKISAAKDHESLPNLDAMIKAIDLRANYIGPVLEEILHIRDKISPRDDRGSR